MKLLRGSDSGEIFSAALDPEDSWAYDTDEEDTSNYFLRHWHGNLTLPVSYWVNGGIVAFAIVAFLGVLVRAVSEAGSSLRAISIVACITVLLIPAIWVWSVVGIWRSAGKHADRGGSAGWARAAKVMVVLGAFSMAGQTKSMLVPQFMEFAQIAIGHDPIGEPASIRVSPNGKAILFDGAITEGSANRFQAVIDSAPSANTIVLNSRGGRILEAEAIADIIRAKGLKTYVEHLCASACPLIFIAGSDRAAEPNARIGFHQSSFPGLSASDISDAEVQQRYIDAGIDPSFVEKAYSTPSDSMWYPSHDELAQAGVISRTSLGGEVASALSAVSNRKQLEMAFLQVPVFRSFRGRYPNEFGEVVAAAWTVRQAGGSDGEITTAARTKFTTFFPQIMSHASDEDLAKYLALLVEELSAARSLSVEACDKLTQGQLDISRALPPSLTGRELALLQSILDSTGKAELDRTAATIALRTAMDSLSKRDINALMSPAAATPSDRCEASTDLYESLQKLDLHSRTSGLRFMLTSS